VIEFDEAKRQANLAKHGCDFLIVDDFDWSTAIVREDTRFGYGETRLVALGFVGVNLYSLVYTERGSTVRVISLRTANRKERMLYAKAKL